MNKERTEIIFLLDRSGSMAGLERDTIGGFNSLIKQQCKLLGDTLLTTVLFDHDYEVLWNGIDAKMADLTDNEYYVRGTTALLDAVGKTILDVGHRLAETNEDQRPGKVIFVITTDGMENASREFTYEKVQDLILRQQERYHWEFIFLGANIDAVKEADSLGISKESVYEFEASEIGVDKMYSLVNEEIAVRRERFNDRE
ncbi:VWA domain-containing protein [Oceanobacillus longus]|uniref:VWA domain-containing protein n=1 Tax=Oceanobacillus longus TaxID=930120 RepID=A0ABV8GUJ2_9BACI